MVAGPVHLDQVRFLALLELGLLATESASGFGCGDSFSGRQKDQVGFRLCGQTAPVNHHEAVERYREDHNTNDPRLNVLVVTAARLLVVTIH